MREQLVAYAGDCVVRGDVELGEGRLSDAVNQVEILTFTGVTLEALDDGHLVEVDEIEVERRDLHLIEVRGRRGDPSRRLRTAEDRVLLEVGPFVVTGSLHRSPNAQPLAALHSWAKFVPVTDAVIGSRDGSTALRSEEVLLVNRERISKSQALAYQPSRPEDPWDVRHTA